MPCGAFGGNMVLIKGRSALRIDVGIMEASVMEIDRKELHEIGKTLRDASQAITLVMVDFEDHLASLRYYRGKIDEITDLIDKAIVDATLAGPS